MTELDVCVGSACHVRGAYNIVQAFQQMIEENSLHGAVDLKTTFCVRECQNQGVAVSVGGVKYSVLPEDAAEFFESSVRPALGNSQG